MTYFADITEPDIGQRARSLAVDTFQLIFSNDHVAQRRSILQDEHGAVGTCLMRMILGHTGKETYRCHRRYHKPDHDRTPGCPGQHCL